MSNYRFNEHAFHTYEEFIAKIVEAYPASITITPADCKRFGKACETVRARLRDAIKAYINNPQWPTTKINRAKWSTIADPYKELKCRSLDDGTIIAGKDEAALAPSTFVFGEPKLDKVYFVPEQSAKELIVSLCIDGVIPNGVRVAGFTISDIAHFESTADVTFSKLDNGEYLLR